MDDAFFVKPLRRRQIDQAFPLVSAVSPGLGMAQWRAFAAALTSPADLESASPDPMDVSGPDDSGAPPPPAGIMTVQSERGYIHGLFSYVVEPDLRHGRVLAADNFLVLDLFDTTGPAGALLRAMEGLARRLDCGAIHTSVAVDHGPLADTFRAEGHRPEGRRLCKPLAGVGAFPG